ncbi:MAG: FAD-dependent oxidoreductase [Anaerolineae bacterium]|nr:FAD-dependent oxidoreductase [Anaerolineae bacterium]
MSKLDYDIIVAGGGTAGAAAAIAAARRGWRVLLVEEQNCLGGASTAGGVGEWFASLEGMGDIFDATVRELERFGARYGNQKVFNHEYLKIIWQLLAEQAGVELLFHASIFGVTKEGNTLTEVQIVCASQTLVARARFFIDATGEGDLSFLAGAAFMQGDPQSGAVLHMTLTAWMYDTGKVQEPYLPEELTSISGPEDLPGLGTGWVVGSHRVYLNATKVMGHDPTDPFSLSAAEREARRQLIRVVAYVQCHKFPTYALASSGASIGIREGRRIVGEHVLTQDEILNRTDPLIFEDGIAVGTSQVDFHSLTEPGAAGWRKRVEPYNIPFRCLMVKGFHNLLTAGKCISTDQVVHSSCRMTPTCCAIGQAAGVAAALALETQANTLRDISIPELRAILSAEDIELDPRKHRAYAPNDGCP